MWAIANFFGYVIAGILGAVMFSLFSEKLKKFFCLLYVRNVMPSINVLEIQTEEECQKACIKLKSHCQDLSALGFDCEWVSVQGKRRPVALLQLATVHGLCCLFRLNSLGTIYKELDDLLSDPKIIKLGICPLQDAKYLKQDYSAQVCSTLDLRYLYPGSQSLAAMAASEIGVKLDKSLKIKASNWEALELTHSQKDYAAKDAFVAVEIFKKWLLQNSSKTFNLYPKTIQYDILFTENLKSEVSKYLDISFKQKGSGNSNKKNNKAEGETEKESNKKGIKAETRKSPLYDNCFMHAPDGELLCSCDERKAHWYVQKGLAEVLPGEPYSIRLLFEPAGRAEDAKSKKFYQQLKQNCCVVCGADDFYLKHYIVPREYRKYFPNIMKDHQSHDIVLMCVRCHQLASKHNENLKQKLANLCNAPTKTTRLTQDRNIQKIKNYAKALIKQADFIPVERKHYLESEIKQYYNVDTLTPELLLEAANLKSKIIDENYEGHGIKVVKYFMQHEGLSKLVTVWREQFLNTMKPKYLPAFWSVTHRN